MSSSLRICLLGLGEVGQTLASDLLAHGERNLIAWDTKFNDRSSTPCKALERISVRAATSAEEAALDADLIVSAVTAGQCLQAATSIVPHAKNGAYYLDLNSVSPRTKQSLNSLLVKRGVHFVEAAVMSPIAPKRMASPILLGGPYANNLMTILQQLGFTGATVFSAEIGKASAAKMCRSVVVKGMEALLAESLVTAHYYGVEKSVLESLCDLFPLGDWSALSHYMITRSIQHGARRAEEVREVARTIEEAGIKPWMSTGCVKRQQWAAEFPEAARCDDLSATLDYLLQKNRIGTESEHTC